MTNQKQSLDSFGFSPFGSPNNLNNIFGNNVTNNHEVKERNYKLKKSSEIVRISGELKKEIEILNGCYSEIQNNMNTNFCKSIRQSGIKYIEYHQKAPSGTFASFHTDDLTGVTDSEIITIATGKANYKSGIVKNFALKDEKVFEEIKTRYNSFKSSYEEQLDTIKKQINTLSTNICNYKKNNLGKTIDYLKTAKTNSKNIVIERKNGSNQKISSRINEIELNCKDYSNSITEIKI